jgi:hypothetical protein
MRRKRLARLLKKLRAMRRSLPSLVQLLMRLDAAKTAAGRVFQFVHLQVPKEGQEVTRETFQFHMDKKNSKRQNGATDTTYCAPTLPREIPASCGRARCN